MKDNSTAPNDPSLPEEARLVERAKSGDAEAFARLYDAYVERVSRYVYFRVAEDCDVEDLVSQVFLKAWENLDRYRMGNSPFAAWLYTIARNLVIDHYRTKKDILTLEDILALPADMELPDEQAQTRFDLEALRDALQFLTPDQQQALILKYIAGLPNGSIAKIMNKQEGTVRGLQMRGLQTLAKYMKEKEVL
ncbi:MAG TPA: sigma-70 family RNA polymerase sigma factor [Anaerolineales bacterium]|nr:sigma-70 family RNA polymerase sigma factor [Anaerolineales bacterium]